MRKILVIGAGAMGAAFTFPLVDNNHKVTLTEPYNKDLQKKLLKKNKFHPTLKLKLSKKVSIKKFSSELLNEKWDLVVVAVSSIGIDMVREHLKNIKRKVYALRFSAGNGNCTWCSSMWTTPSWRSWRNVPAAWPRRLPGNTSFRS